MKEINKYSENRNFRLTNLRNKSFNVFVLDDKNSLLGIVIRLKIEKPNGTKIMLSEIRKNEKGFFYQKGLFRKYLKDELLEEFIEFVGDYRNANL